MTLLSALVGCSMNSTVLTTREPRLLWYETTAPKPRGVIMLVGGLNNRPEIMAPLAEELQLRGFHAFTVSLTGHAQGEWLEDASAEKWLRDLDAAYDVARTRHPNTPFSTIGFSLGGTLTTAWLLNSPEIRASHSLLIAPAIWFPGHAAFLRLLAYTPFSLPSFMPQKIRVHRLTPLSAYRALFTLSDRIKTATLSEGMRHTPTLVIMAKGDELVSYSATQQWIQSINSPAWRFEPADVDKLDYQHLLLWPRPLTPKWAALTKRIERFLSDS